MKYFYLIITLIVITSCVSSEKKTTNNKTDSEIADSLAIDVANETLRSWLAYKKYAWGHDVLKPLSKSYSDWYNEPLYISPIDAYSTLHLMGFNDEAQEILNYVVDSLDFNKDIYAKIFEVNIRILGGLLAMYDISGDERVLEKSIDFADRMMPAFNTKTGIPKYWVNLKTGEAKGDTVNVAEAGTYVFEMGILSYFTNDPKYYQAAKKATLAVYNRKSEIGLIGDVIDVETGEWVSTHSHICAGVDSYYEYLFKSYLMFGDPDLKEIWDHSIEHINRYMAEDYNNQLWYGRVDMTTGEQVSSVVTLYDAFFPAVLALNGDTQRAIRLQETWFWLWRQYGLEPMVYDYKTGYPNYPIYDLNPEIMESAYYLLNTTGNKYYYDMNSRFWSDIKKFCRTDVAFTSVGNVTTMAQKDYMPTFFFAETLKYLYLTFSNDSGEFLFDEYIFNTEAHQFRKSNFNKEEAKVKLGY